MIKNKLRFLITLIGVCLLTSIPLIAASCSRNEIVKKTYYSKSKTENGLDVLREYSPSALRGILPFEALKEVSIHNRFSVERLWEPIYLFDLIKTNKAADDHFKSKHAASYDQIKKLWEQYDSRTKPKSENLQILAEIRKLKIKIANDWQQNNIALNKNKIFHILNSSEDFKNIQTKRFEKYFKDFDFSNKSILLIKGYWAKTGGAVAKGAGYWIKNLTISNNTINIQFEYRDIPIIKKGDTKIISPASGTSSTVHLVVVDKINNLDNYQFNVSVV